MNLKITLMLISAVMLMMLGAGAASAYIGYLMGREALKVVTQPNTNSENNLDRQKPVGGTHKGLTVIEERSVLINVYNHIQQKKQSGKYLEQSSVKKSPPKKPDKQILQSDLFPLSNQSNNVTMAITQARIEGNSVTLDVNLKNESERTVRFLYSFLDVRDEQNRPLSAIADGLPGKLPPNGQNFSGKFIIPATLLENTRKISLTLKDYPEQNLILQLNSVPVAR